MAQHTDLNETLEAWADIVLKKWEDRIKRLGLSGSQLLQSLDQYIHREANGNPEIIDFIFNYYGKFVDMGVRRGAPLGSGKEQPREWYSKIFYQQVQRLSQILKEKYEERAALTIIENIDDNANAHDKRHHTV
ncbi:MAG: hypothetical protein ACK5L5_06580 [Bacteroidales bacterium]